MKAAGTVKVWVAVKDCARPSEAKVSVAVMFGRFRVWVVVCALARVSVLPVVMPVSAHTNCLVASAEFWMTRVPSRPTARAGFG